MASTLVRLSGRRPAAIVAPGAFTLAIYGLYHRRAGRTQTPDDARLISASGELWGRAPRGSDLPTVKAWTGSIPPGHLGIEFVTEVQPDPGTPKHEAKWRVGTPGVHLSDDGEFAKIAIVVTRNTQV